ncbi:hypothetical protein llap_15299 [Limosa lapponica baueri]|uniref:Uncharacterized protein n=1 Tax=Limosa lapponica baueri TaxID=1758121 RepID=A0A2I0TKS0_LIMLA|nr:hypothetical protein llap_15299 [Limosa lapponica baueri]
MGLVGRRSVSWVFGLRWLADRELRGGPGRSLGCSLAEVKRCLSNPSLEAGKPSSPALKRTVNTHHKPPNPPNEKMQQVIKKTIEEAKALISKKQVQANVCVNMEMVKDALDQLRGAVMIVYPMGLPPHDPIRMEFEDKEDLSGTHKGQGAPGREPLISHEEQKQMMLYYYRKQEELKKLEEDDDDSFLNAEWADNHALKRQFHGVKDIKWGPR